MMGNVEGVEADLQAEIGKEGWGFIERKSCTFGSCAIDGEF